MRRKLGQEAPFVPAEVRGESENTEKSTSFRVNNKEPPGLQTSELELLSFPFASVFLLEEHLICRRGRGRRRRGEKRSLPRIKFVLMSAGNRQWLARRSLGESQQELRAQMFQPVARADTHTYTRAHTLTHTHTLTRTHTHSSSISLCSRLEFLPGSLALLLASLPASPLSKQRAAGGPSAPPGRTAGKHPERGRLQGSGRVRMPGPTRAQPGPLRCALPRR